MEETTSTLSGSKYFSKLDILMIMANSGPRAPQREDSLLSPITRAFLI
jgi:hypothetical protein